MPRSAWIANNNALALLTSPLTSNRPATATPPPGVATQQPALTPREEDPRAQPTPLLRRPAPAARPAVSADRPSALRAAARRSLPLLAPAPATLLLCLAAAAPAAAQVPAWQFGAVLDAAYTTRALALGERDQGLQLGHSDLTASGPLGPWLRAQLGATFATHDGRLEHGIEQAFVETTALPGGLQLRGGRFASQVGYLNEQHPHADDFSERPLLYRAFLGGHWSDDGLRLNWTAPTPFFLQFGVEAMRGRRLVEEVAAPVGRVGVATFVAKTGADIGREHAWQLGVSHIRNRREAAPDDHGDHDHDDDHDDQDDDHGHAHDHHHHHGAEFSGRRTWMVDLTWKWAPGGNPRSRQLRVGLEAARISGLNRHAGPRDRHEASAVSVVWRWAPQWEIGARADRLRVRVPHGDHFDGARLREHSLMLAWKPSHLQTVRLQWSGQRDAAGFDDAARRSVQLQFVLGFGAHPAHAF